MTQKIMLPTHTLQTPLSSDDEQILKQALANHHYIVSVIQKAKAAGLDVSQHEARADQHHSFITRTLEQFFPVPMKPQVEPEENLG